MSHWGPPSHPNHDGVRTNAFAGAVITFSCRVEIQRESKEVREDKQRNRRLVTGIASHTPGIVATAGNSQCLQERRKVEEAYVTGLKKLVRRPLQEVGNDLG